MMPVTVEIRRGTSRFSTRVPGRLTRHAFSFGEHYDPERLSFGPIVCHDDHLVSGGQGFEEHAHSDLEIITWVVSGAVRHLDASGREEVVPTGSLAVLSAGSGVRHAESAVVGAGPTRFVQTWLRPDVTGTEPSYAVAALDPAATGLVAAPLRVGVAGAQLSVARLRAGERLELPAVPRLHAFLTRGALLRFSLAEPLAAGDACCFVDEPAHPVVAAVDTELLVWTFAS